MQVSVETTSNLGRRVTVIVPPEQLEEEIKNRLANLSKTAKIEGFRPGKVPSRMIEQRFGASVRGEAVDKLLQSSLNAALQQEKLEPASTPTIESLKAEKGQPLEYIATFEVFPEVKLQSLTDIKLEKLNVDITEADVDRVLEQMRKQHAKWITVARSAQFGDRISFDLTWEDAAAQKTREQKNVAVILEEGRIPKGLEGLKGAKAKEEVKVEISLQGQEQKRIPATAKIIKVDEPELPQLNEEFAKLLDVKGGMAGLRAEVRQHMDQQLEDALRNKTRNQVVEKLLERHQLEVPNQLLETEIEQMKREIHAQRMPNIPYDPNMQVPPEALANLKNLAKQRVILSLIYSALIKKHALKVDFNKVKARVEQIASVFQDPIAMAESMLRDKATLNQVSAQVIEEQVIAKLLEEVQFTEKTLSYAEVMEIGHPGDLPADEHGHEHHHHNHHHEHEH